ncbi:uncharacterized protein BDZ83DRAFT_734606 [Colletotrichum acutatum]|uniref:Uncharacterized protein n=1 Tax=Glomerella acutata TaxID=27357 RepID=A0AAD8UB84_GLOAC|nr:uncharacterized protein BDZ83DRAFT_734606 [Colletotrichum acutatum]KAK1713769.1 hypothetical protein BDZ83DRAFT_734606 [Colletotrichum acutatum]
MVIAERVPAPIMGDQMGRQCGSLPSSDYQVQATCVSEQRLCREDIRTKDTNLIWPSLGTLPWIGDIKQRVGQLQDQISPETSCQSTGTLIKPSPPRNTSIFHSSPRYFLFLTPQTSSSSSTFMLIVPDPRPSIPPCDTRDAEQGHGTSATRCDSEKSPDVSSPPNHLAVPYLAKAGRDDPSQIATTSSLP